MWRRRSQNGTAPRGSMKRIGRIQRLDRHDVADRDRQVLAAVDADEGLVRVDDPAAVTIWRGLTTTERIADR